MTDPAFLVLKLPRDADVAACTAPIETCRGTLLASAAASAVKPLEAGSAHDSVIIARFAFADDLEAAWATLAPAITAMPGAVALATPGLPWEGWPGNFVPTIATVVVPAASTPRAYMLIEGTGHDPDAMDRYRDVILPMLRERGAYYVLFQLGGEVRVLAGDWQQGILAVSRWPSWELAEDFWYSDRYQTVAIPIRTGHGRFDVQIMEGLAG